MPRCDGTRAGRSRGDAPRRGCARRGWLVLAAASVAACAARRPAAPPPPDAAGAEAQRLRAIMLADVPGAAVPDPAQAARWIALARSALDAAGRLPQGTELALLVDRAPAVQRIGLLLLRAEGPWEVLATAPASTGITGRRGYFVTPTGVFVNDGGIMGYRALGTPNREGIRGLGAQGMRAWDFGWVWAPRGWTEDGSEAPIRFLLHATDPDHFEPRLGEPGSQGCVRIGGAMNIFLDRHGVIDADAERIAAESPRMAALLAPDRTPTAIAGRMLIVVDSAAR
ncbi:hypothetical protein [Neoroseomonas eburnea]|uniref:hypothetical protein n=1 Tax=Neoroseomonas eburnea TaxID=1346889 RepID=UPI001BAC3BA8|nr:hypothetical protein [Neoroseomonas eburnea]